MLALFICTQFLHLNDTLHRNINTFPRKIVVQSTVNPPCAQRDKGRCHQLIVSTQTFSYHMRSLVHHKPAMSTD